MSYRYTSMSRMSFAFTPVCWQIRSTSSLWWLLYTGIVFSSSFAAFFSSSDLVPLRPMMGTSCVSLLNETLSPVRSFSSER